MDKQYITLDSGEKLCYYERGSGDKTIVLLCGLGAPMPLADLWAIFVGLAKNAKVIVLDRFGYGGSDITKSSRKIKIVVEEIKEFCDKLKIKDNLYLIGHSLGSYNCLMFAENYPKLLGGVVLLDCFPFPLSSAWFAFNMFLGNWASFAIKKGLLKKTGAIKIYKNTLEKEGVPKKIIAETIDLCITNSYNANVMNELKESRKDVRSLTKQLARAKDVKMLSICRNKTLSFSKKIRRYIPDLQIFNVGKSSHMIHHDHKEEVLKQIDAFIE